jgi:hypothetical protein
VAGLFVVAGAIGAAVWALFNRRADEPVQPEGFADDGERAGEQAEQPSEQQAQEQIGT